MGKDKIPFTISVELHKIQMSLSEGKLTPECFTAIGKICSRRPVIAWLIISILKKVYHGRSDLSIPFFGEKNFLTLSTYAGLLEKFNRKKEADSLMEKAIPMATAMQLLIYGSNLNKMKKHQEAFKIFKMNYDKNPKEDYANLGMVMGYYFLENKKEAMKYAEKARDLTADPGWKNYFVSLISDMNAGKEMFK
jgi:tetratricopeptide (TPR) repeat protein